MSKFNTRATTKTTNLAGGKAMSMNPQMELVHAVLTTFLKDKYYESGSDRLTRIQTLVTQNKPEFVANLAVVARKEFNLRSVSHVLIGELAKTHRGDSLVRDVIVEAAIRPDDLTEILSYVGTPIPKQVKRGVRNALLKFSAYQLAKYKQEGKGMSLVDVFNLVHPKPQHASDEQKEAWKALIEGTLVSTDTWESEIANADSDEERTRQWERLVCEDKMGYMALLRNLNNLVKYKVSDETVDLAVKKLTDPEEVKKSKQLPFRFTTAFDNVQGNRKFSDAISEAMDIAVGNVPELSGTTLIAVDSSGSMSGDPMKKASIFGATLVKANANADLILYDTQVKELTVSGRSPVIDLAKGIERSAMGGGTETSLVFQYALQKGKKYDRFIIISDNESWQEGWRGTSVQSMYNEYKRITGTNPAVYAIDIQGYGTKDVEDDKVYHLTGWSDRLLDFVGKIEDGDTLVKYIKNYKLSTG
jgi:60 kDa SS-A/Ro ribonucleoprotein